MNRHHFKLEMMPIHKIKDQHFLGVYSTGHFILQTFLNYFSFTGTSSRKLGFLDFSETRWLGKKRGADFFGGFRSQPENEPLFGPVEEPARTFLGYLSFSSLNSETSEVGTRNRADNNILMAILDMNYE